MNDVFMLCSSAAPHIIRISLKKEYHYLLRRCECVEYADPFGTIWNHLVVVVDCDFKKLENLMCFFAVSIFLE